MQVNSKQEFFSSFFQTLKPIFHCDAKLLALGTFTSPKMLVSFASGDVNFSRFTRRET